MANNAETTITLTEAPDDDELAVIAEGLRAYNEAQAGYSDSLALAVLVRDHRALVVVRVIGQRDRGFGFISHDVSSAPIVMAGLDPAIHAFAN